MFYIQYAFLLASIPSPSLFQHLHRQRHPRCEVRDESHFRRRAERVSGGAAEREVDLRNVPGWTIHFGERQIASCSMLKLYGLSKTQLDLFWPKAKRIRSENLLHKGGLLGSLCPQDVYNFCAMSRRWGHRSAWHETEKSGMTWFSKEQENSCSLFWITKSGVAGLDLEMQRPQVRVSEGRLVWTKVSLMLKITFDTFGGMH